MTKIDVGNWFKGNTVGLIIICLVTAFFIHIEAATLAQNTKDKKQDESIDVLREVYYDTRNDIRKLQDDNANTKAMVDKFDREMAELWKTIASKRGTTINNK